MIRLSDLPPPPAGKTGWPWTEAAQLSPPAMPDGGPWPKISIVTPSYNQGEFIEETIRSILLQGYPNLEYLIVDGVSKDNSIEIIRKYEPWLTACVIEPDTGQPDAINKGFSRTTGDILQWINSDDFLLPGALAAIAQAFVSSGGKLVAGRTVYFGMGQAEFTGDNTALSSEGLIRGWRKTAFHQPALWLNARHMRALGKLAESYHYAFDWHLLIRYLERWPDVVYINQELVKFRLHEDSKSVSSTFRFQPDRLDVLRGLLHEDITPRTRYYCNARLSQEDWWRYMENMKSDIQAGGLSKYEAALKIGLNALARPDVRCNRFTAGVLKTVLTA